jgi:uncharacterized protein (TIGR04255 family)
MGRKMKAAPVYFTLGQVHHNPLLNLVEYVPSIQERMRKAGYPDFKRVKQMQVDLSANLAGRETEEGTQSTVLKVERFLFSDIELVKGFVLHNNSLSFQTTAYETFEDFLQQLKLGLEILGDVVGGLSFMERVGLRYLDAIVPATGETLSQYVVNELQGLPARLPDSTFLYSFAEAMMSAPDGGQVVSRTVIQNGKLNFPPDINPSPLVVGTRFSAIAGEHAVIDTDGSFVERQAFNAIKAETRLHALHDLIDKAFRASATDHARKVWGAVEES